MSTFYRGNPAQVIQKQVAADAAGTASAVSFSEGGGATGVTMTTPSVFALTGYSAITFPQGLGDDPAQPFFMNFIPKKITSAVGGTMGDMSF